MKTKKKPIPLKPSPPIKLLNIKTLEPQKNTPITTQKTYLTIQENIRTFQNAQTQSKADSLKARFSFGRKSCHQRMEEHNLSPFSNDGRSASPKYRKTPQKILASREEKQVRFAINLKQLEKKKPPKPKPNSARESFSKKPTTPSHSRTAALNSVKQQPGLIKKKPAMKKKRSDKSDKQEKARIEFQNEFLSMMNNRIDKQKITELSDQQGSIRKNKPALEICIQTSQNNSSRSDIKFKSKKDLVKTMQLKVMKNIQRDYPNLDVTQKRVICAVIIVQRLWRQRKVKQFFEHYVTPKASPECSFRESLQKESSDSTMNLLAGHVARREESKSWDAGRVQRKRPATGFKGEEDNFLIRQQSQQQYKQLLKQHKPTFSHNQSSRQQSRLNQKVTSLLQASILPFQNQNQKITNQPTTTPSPSMLKFIQCYRQLKLSSTKKQTKSKRNIFSLKQSLSEKCLMQKYYTRIFSDRPEKDKPKNYELFSLGISNESLKQNQQSSIELFREMGKKGAEYLSPRKPVKQEDEVWVRNETSYGEEDGDSDQLGKERGFRQDQVIINERDSSNKKVIVDEILFGQGFFTGNDMCDIKTESFIPQNQVSPKRQLLQQTSQQVHTETQCGIVINKHSVEKPQYQVSDVKQQSSSQPLLKQIPQYSLKSIQTASESILNQLLQQFFSQYMAFEQKQCLVKKHRKPKQQAKDSKPKLPGIQISAQSITQYLNILIPYILENDRPQVLKSLELFHPSTYQKCHRVESVVYELFQFADEEQDDIYWNIITNQGFFACLQQYWKTNVVLTKEKEKFMNFIDLTYKVYNRCITDAFSQLFNKQVLQRVVYPWNALGRTRRNQKILFVREVKELLNPQLIDTIVEEVKLKLLKQSFCYSTTGGKLIKKDKKHTPNKKQYEFGEIQQQELIIQKLSDDQFTKVMKIADDQFLQDEKELMHCLDQRYELCGDITESILKELMGQLQQQLATLQSVGSQDLLPETKSQQQVFLQTNQTLETNYHF